MSKGLDQDFLLKLALRLDRALDRQDEQTEKLLELAGRLETSCKCQQWLTQRFSRLILEKSIHETLADCEAEKKRRERFYDGHPGVPRKVLSHD